VILTLMAITSRTNSHGSAHQARGVVCIAWRSVRDKAGMGSVMSLRSLVVTEDTTPGGSVTCQGPPKPTETMRIVSSSANLPPSVQVAISSGDEFLRKC